MLNVKKTLTKILQRIDVLETRTLLWTNPNPDSSFAGQKVAVDLTNYDSVEIEVKNIASSEYMVANTYRSKKGEKGLILASAATNRERDINDIDNTGITFGNGIVYNTYGGGQSTDNNRLIPIRIFGIKLGGGN